MSKTLAKVAVIAGAVALVATGVGAVAVAGTVAATTAASVATYASLAAGLATLGAQTLAKKPAAKGSVNSVTIASDAPSPYLMGRTYFGGVLRHDVGYGGTISKVKNPYRGMVITYSVAGPLEALEAQTLDFAETPFSGNAATGYYAGFLYRDVRLGLPVETALQPFWPGMPNWTADHRLSGKAAILWSLKFDKAAKRFASGVPVQGAVWRGVKVYDPRLDSTYPGGSGPQRVGNEATWTWSENPGLHALTYALGRYRNGQKVFGVGMPPEGLLISHFVELANVCDANGWKLGGVIFEPGDRWANLKDILQAGCAEPLFLGGKLGLRINAPRVAIDTIRDDDLADGDAEVVGMQTWRERRNGLIPKYRSEANRWDYVQSDLVTVPAYVTEDGEEKHEERQFNLVQDKDQAAQLAGYELANGRERGPITLQCKPRMRRYGAGDMLTLDLPEHGMEDVDAIIIDRAVNPADMTVTLTLMTEAPGKHDFVLALTGTAPPPPAVVDPADRDDISSAIVEADTGTLLIQNSSNADVEITSADTSGTASITIANHSRVYADKTVAVAGATLSGLTNATTYYLAYDDPDRAGGAVTYIATQAYADAFLSAAHPARHFVGSIVTATAGGGATGGGGSTPPGSGGRRPNELSNA